MLYPLSQIGHSIFTHTIYPGLSYVNFVLPLQKLSEWAPSIECLSKQDLSLKCSVWKDLRFIAKVSDSPLLKFEVEGGGWRGRQGKRKSSPEPYINLHTEYWCLTEPSTLRKSSWWWVVGTLESYFSVQLKLSQAEQYIVNYRQRIIYIFTKDI